MKLSARNVLPGKVLGVKKGPATTLVKIEIAPGLVITSSITTDAATELKLKKGASAYAVIKASSVLLAID